MNDLERYCLEEIEAVEETTFMYQLHECGFFDKMKFQQFLKVISELVNCYVENGKTKNYEGIVSGIVDCFSYIMLLFYCHLDHNDMYVIENYNDIKEEIPEFFENMRIATRNIITITNNKPTEQGGTLPSIISNPK